MKPWLNEQIRAQGLENVTSLPYQEFWQLSRSRSAAAVRVVAIAESAVGATQSSGIYNALLLVRPVLAFAPQDSHVAEIIRESGARWVVAPSDLLQATETLAVIAALDGNALSAMGESGRELARDRFRQFVLVGELCELVGPALYGFGPVI